KLDYGFRARGGCRIVAGPLCARVQAVHERGAARLRHATAPRARARHADRRTFSGRRCTEVRLLRWSASFTPVQTTLRFDTEHVQAPRRWNTSGSGLVTTCRRRNSCSRPGWLTTDLATSKRPTLFIRTR